MRAPDLLLYGYEHVQGTLRRAISGLDAEQLNRRVGPDANTIAWLAWHLARVQDAQVAAAAGHEQVWTAQGWADRFGLPFDTSATGYGMSSDDVARCRVESADLLLDYAAAVHERTAEYLRGLSEDDLDRVVDTRWDPPVTLGVRLVSILADDLQHVGQAAYIRGLLTSG
jgi:uncharacterized damage-inducible protein DinB